jgi:acyl-CoA synthetase (AMP-forming)/AMP-acid ligase II
MGGLGPHVTPAAKRRQAKSAPEGADFGERLYCLDQTGFATAEPGGETTFGSPPCHCTMRSAAPACRPSLRAGTPIGTLEQIMRVVELGARDPLEKRLSNVGRLLPGVDQRIADPATGTILPAGEVGEIRVKGYVTTGYYKDPERTREAFDEHGFFRTGDLRLLDAEGYLHFRGRIKEIVKTGGINVAPIEVEEVLPPCRPGRLRIPRTTSSSRPSSSPSAAP